MQSKCNDYKNIIININVIKYNNYKCHNYINTHTLKNRLFDSKKISGRFKITYVNA